MSDFSIGSADRCGRLSKEVLRLIEWKVGISNCKVGQEWLSTARCTKIGGSLWTILLLFLFLCGLIGSGLGYSIR